MTAAAISKLEEKRRVLVSGPETNSSALAAEGDLFRECRILIDAAQRDVAEGAFITHTTLGEIEAGLAVNDRHFRRIRLTLQRIAAQRIKRAGEAIEKLAA